ncbi:hypothetical protein RCG23_19010 [Neobacillus sp. PS3-34]|uniref:hypothetical protein n=1 Tax=Neobacillus sp. PS3-34 TaxID=3070678 RepID=UPI0027DFB8F1|nr:hypothetical protein [Neobacillus sp. PS3-34]WML47491.1 hypothetical protein RCG23_19010 [Neobacillus sp. PS3-34]
MPPRHGFPMQGGMGPRMMGGPGPQGRMGSMGMNPFQQRPLMGQMMGRSGQMNGGGGACYQDYSEGAIKPVQWEEWLPPAVRQGLAGRVHFLNR